MNKPEHTETAQLLNHLYEVIAGFLDSDLLIKLDELKNRSLGEDKLKEYVEYNRFLEIFYLGRTKGYTLRKDKQIRTYNFAGKKYVKVSEITNLIEKGIKTSENNYKAS